MLDVLYHLQMDYHGLYDIRIYNNPYIYIFAYDVVIYGLWPSNQWQDFCEID